MKYNLELDDDDIDNLIMALFSLKNDTERLSIQWAHLNDIQHRIMGLIKAQTKKGEKVTR